MRTGLENELAAGNNSLDNPLSSSANAGMYEVGDTISTIHGDMTVTGVDHMGRPQVDRYGEDLNWEDSFGPASKHLGVNEAQWQAFISGVNEIKAAMRAYEGNEARVMQTRSQGEDAIAERRIGVLMNTQGLTRDEAEAEVYGSEGYAERQAHFEEYEALNQELNDLYASVGLDPTGAIQGSGTNSPGYAVNFDFVSGDVSHTKGDAIHQWGKAAILAAASIVAGPAISSSLTGLLGAGAAKAATAGILSTASQYMATGEVDWEQAIISAAIAYGGNALGDAIKGSDALSGITDKISGVSDKFTELVTQGNTIAEAALKAGGMSLLTQMVTTGEIDPKQAAFAALVGAGSQGFTEWKAGMEAAGQPVTDEFLQDLAEQEEFQQAAIDADIKDPFLNPNYKTVGDGLVMNVNDNQVYGVTDDKNHGSMKDLDLDGDGVLSGADLEPITTDNEYVNDNVYGDVPLAPPGSTTSPTAFTREWMDERYAGMSREQMLDQMQRDGFEFDSNGNLVDKAALDYLNNWDATNDLNLQDLNTASYGDIDVNMEDPYTIGQTEDGQYYIARVTDNGEVGFTTISEEQYNELYKRVYGQPGITSQDYGNGIVGPVDQEKIVGAIGTGDWSSVDEYLSENGIGSAGTVVTGSFDADGNPLGYTEGYEGDGWITLKDGNPDATSVTANFPTDDPTDPTDPTDPNSKQNAPDGDPNNSTKGGGSSTSNATDAGAGSAGTQGADAPKPADAYSSTFIQAIASATSNDVSKIIERINNGESPAQIMNDPTGANVVQTTDGNTTVTPATNTGAGTNSGSSSSGGPTGEEEDTPKDGDPCTTSDGRKGVIQNGACVFQPTVLGVDPSVWADDSNTTGGNTDSNNSGGDNNGNNSGNTTTNAATPAPGNPDSGTSPGILVVADDVWGTGSSGDGNTGTGDGTGEGEGDGEGEGGGGNGGNGGNGGVAKSGRGGSNTQWSPLYAGSKFRRFDKRARQGMMQMAQAPNFTAQDNSQLRMGLLSSIAKDLA